MIIDSSAIIAIALGEPEAEAFVTALAEGDAMMSVANWFECALVVDHRDPKIRAMFDATIKTFSVKLAPVTIEQAMVAREANRRFGRGSGSPAKLNYGDCFAYALAVTTGQPLLFKGNDFTHTDIRSVL